MKEHMFKCTVWTDFGVPSSDEFLSEAAARAHGEHAISALGCVRYTVTPGRALNWQPASKLTVRNWKKTATK